MLAPLAIVAFAIVFLIVLSNSGTNSDNGGPGPTSSAATTTTTGTSTTRSTSKFTHRRTYTVRTGDTLGSIAIKTGVSVTNLEDLNPGLDPEGLVAGQKLKLR